MESRSGVAASGPPRGALAAALACAGLTFAYVLAFPLALGRADESTLLFESRRLFDGQVPYRDYFQTLTPLSLYLFAGVYAVAGTSLLAARLCIAAVMGLGVGVLFHLVRRVAGLPEAALAALLFAGLCLPVWMFASPHWLTTTAALLTAAVLLGAPRARHPHRQASGTEARADDVLHARLRPFLAGTLGGVAICVQQQRGAFLALWLPVALLVLSAALPRASRWRRLGGGLAWSAAGGAVVVLMVLGFAAWQASLATLVELLVGFALQHYGPSHAGRTAWAAVLPLSEPHGAATWLWLLRLVPLLALVEGLCLLRGWRGRGRRELERVALWSLALLMAVSIWYLPDVIHVAFVLPFLLIPAATLLFRLRTSERWAAVPGGRLAAAAAVWVLMLPVLGKAATTLRAAHAAAPEVRATAFGRVALTGDMAALHDAVQRHLVREPDGRAVLYSYPADPWLYLALGADNPTRFSLMIPSMFPAADVEQVIATLRARRAGTVVLLVPFHTGPADTTIGQVIEAGYTAVEDVGPYRVHIRSPAEAPAAAAPVGNR